LAERRESEDEAGALSLERLLELVTRHWPPMVAATGLCLAVALAWFGTRAPVFRARATLILDQQGHAGGILGDLAALTESPQAASEMELLRSRTTAELAVSQPADAADAQRRLGLTTLVEDPALRPFRSLGSVSAPARLLARVEDGATPGGSAGPRRLRVDFLAPDRVRLRRTGFLARFGIGSDSLDVDLDPARPIEYEGLRLWLEPQGDLTGRTFYLRRLCGSDAVQRVLDSTRVRETERGSGVIELVFDDSDPARAADTANALCRNYIDRNQARSEKRASQTIDFIQTQLDEQVRDLHRAEKEVVELQQKSPRAVDIGKTGEALIAQGSQLEVQRVQARMMQVAVRQALALLETGRMEALSRLTGELSDPITATYVESIARLGAERELQERSDAGAYKSMLQAKALELESRLDSLELELDAVRRTRAAVAAGDGEAVARLGAGPWTAGDPLLAGYLADLARLQGELALLANEFTGVHPDRASIEKQIEGVAARIASLLANRLAGLEAQRDEQRALLASYRARAGGYSGDERARIDDAIGSLKARTATHLEARLAGLEASERSLAEEIAALERSLGALPEEERALADPLRRLSAHAEIVKFLLSRQQEAQITRASTVASADFIDPATPPLRRHGPSLVLHLFAGLLAGAGLSLALGLARESFRRGVFTSAELEEASGLPVFATIPDFASGRYRVRSAGADFVPLRDDPEGPVAESIRSLRANLKFALAEGTELKTIACTSCAPGEGKSLTNIALAMAFAMNGKRVLLVDADMRRPSVQRCLGLDLAPGLSDILEGRIPWRECLNSDVEHGLDVITAGKQPHSPSDLLDSEGCGELLAELRAEYDLVVLDVPPALAVSDTDSIAARLDALLLLCKSDKVGADVVGAAAHRLRQAGAKLIGAVLNAARYSVGNRKYGYGYGYGEAYGGRLGREPVSNGNGLH
jgi:capsular exopolysaccharide synthesis family protein